MFLFIFCAETDHLKSVLLQRKGVSYEVAPFSSFYNNNNNTKFIKRWNAVRLLQRHFTVFTGV